jgi:hypothetical protein
MVNERRYSGQIVASRRLPLGFTIQLVTVDRLTMIRGQADFYPQRRFQVLFVRIGIAENVTVSEPVHAAKESGSPNGIWIADPEL